MKIKICLFFLFIILFFSNKELLSNQYKIIATIDNRIITEVDIINEIELLKFVNNKNLPNIKSVALNNLITEEIKKKEINRSKITVDDKIINNYFISFIEKLKKNNSEIKNTYKSMIIEKIKIDYSWNKLISKEYAWKVNINIDEINEKIRSMYGEISEEDFIKYKEDMINKEQNKKLQVYSKYHLNKIKRSTLVKYFE